MRATIAVLGSILLCASVLGQPSKVELRRDGEGWELLRNGEAYMVNGGGGSAHLKLLHELGGNCIRTWGAGELEARRWPDGRTMGLLDVAHEKGLTVVAGFWVGHPRHGFNYDDEKAVERQIDEARAFVRKYKDHPALLMWGVGNEVEISGDRERAYIEVNRIAKAVKEIDTDHPTMYAMASVGGGKAALFKKHCPDVDVMGVNTYGGLQTTPDELRKQRYDGPYMVTEWGPLGHWESYHTDWGAPVEMTSTQKGEFFRVGYDKGIKDVPACLGSFAFMWGQKQERTSTWYGMFLASGEKVASVDVMAKEWSGRFPSNRAPGIDPIETPVGAKRVAGGKPQRATVRAWDDDNDTLEYHWEIRKESSDRRSGGDLEARPALIGEARRGEGGPTYEFTTPAKGGAYRLFVTVYDGEGGAATANIPFFVK